MAVGCGRVFQRFHLPAIRDTAEVMLVGVCEVDAGRREWAAGTLQVPVFNSLARLVEAVDSDAALIATPPATHGELAATCLARGWSVLVEKPLTEARSDAVRLIDAVERAGRVLRVGFNRRYRRSYAALRDRLRDGTGPGRVEFTFVADAARWNPTAGRPTSPAAVLHDAGSHAFDLVAWVAGRRIRRLRAQIPTTSAPVRGVWIEIEASLEGEVPAHVLVGHADGHDERLMVESAGARRIAEGSGRGVLGRLSVRASLAVRKLAGLPTPTDESFRLQMAAFAAACQGHADGLGATAADGLAATAAVEACLESLAGGGAWCEIRGDV